MCAPSPIRGRGVDHSRRMHARFVTRRLREKFQSMGKCQIRILAAQQGRGNGRELVGHDYCRSLCSPRRSRILWIGNKGKLSRAGFLDSSYPGNFQLRRAIFQPRSKSAGKLGKFHRF